MKKKLLFLTLSILLLSIQIFAGTTGKISGRVVDANSGEPLPFVNIIVVGTTMGAASDINGYFTILNVPPGNYDVKASAIGFTSVTVKGVKVIIDLTTKVNFKLNESSLKLSEVVVVAKKEVIKKDVAGSQKSISAKDIQSLPISSVGGVLGLQAGITSNLSIRGGSSSQTLFVVDGISLRDERTNDPISGIPLSAVQQIAVQSGGLNAEYNNVRSGVVNVVTREGGINSYSGTLTFKIKPPVQKHFGISPYDPNSYWLRPYLDPEVAWTGTSSWDEYTQKQYPKWDGWNAFSQATLKDNDPTNDLTAEEAQRIFKYQYRKQGDIKKPDYYFDAGFGGPVPFISKPLGNLRFFASYKRERNMYLMELSRDALTDQTMMVKFTSDLKESMKLDVIALYGETFGTTRSRSGGTSMMTSVGDVASAINTSSFTVPWRIYTDIYYAPTARYNHVFSAKLTHVLSPKTFYEIQLKQLGTKYFTNAPKLRDTTKSTRLFDDYFVDEAPIGFEPNAVFSIDGSLGMGGAVSTSRDYSKINTYSAKFDIISQIDNHNQIKSGAKFVYDDFDMGFGMVNFFLPEGNTWTTIKRQPYRSSAYVQDKIEYEGWISTLGVIAEYSNSNGNWYGVGPYNRDFFSQSFKDSQDPIFKTQKAKGIFTLSPRLAISHPITENSKLYFNYGHFREMAASQNLYRVQRNVQNKLDLIGDPTLPLTKTVSYELGYDQALFNQYLLHLAAYYKDITEEELYTRYISFDGKVNYQKLTDNSYEDIFGFEVDLTKMYGKWVTGDVNFEYRVGSSGFFGALLNYEDPAAQREYLRRNPVQLKPRPQPRFKSYIDIHTPDDFGPSFAGQKIFGDWHFNFISRWTSGAWFTWNPNNIPGIQDNVQWTPYYNIDLKIGKVFPLGSIDLKFFVDVNNLFNFKHFSGISFRDIHDREAYFKSLHLPEDIAKNLGYHNITGNDQPGDFRDYDVNFVPMEWINTTDDITSPSTRPIYYVSSTKQYMQYTDGQWKQVDQSKVDQVLNDKAYIDMPNQSFFTFLNPRNIYIGFTINYHF